MSRSTLSTSSPDLSIPVLPDPDDIFNTSPAPTSADLHARVAGGVMGDIEWPESGPSRLPAGASARASASDKEPEPALGPLGAKLVAAMTGAMMTSLLSEFRDLQSGYICQSTDIIVTPFDVLKTRLQTIRPDPYHFEPPSAPSVDCCQTSLITPRRQPANINGATATAAKKNSFTCFTSVEEIPARYARSARAAFSSLTAAATALPAPAPRGCSFPSKWAGMWGEAVTMEEALARTRGGAGGAGGYAALVLPRDKAGFWSEMAAVRKEVGVRGLWKGVGPTL